MFGKKTNKAIMCFLLLTVSLKMLIPNADATDYYTKVSMLKEACVFEQICITNVASYSSIFSNRKQIV
ncbi:MAG: hypothetical protein JKY49_01945 [Cohaesibacteraceae bacterium]|nr:hypothetical protein [Cohaesibacteraceae bacterium]MBL4876481.1 hypothetical protein [Cohaesibacteraceae bacterium]